VGTIKSNTSKALRIKFAFLKKVYWDDRGIWAKGYFVSIVRINEKIIKAYVKMQEKEDTGQAELEFRKHHACKGVVSRKMKRGEDFMINERLGKYRERLVGLIPEERIVTANIARPSKWIIEEFKKLSGVTSTVSDILDSMGIRGAVPASIIKPLQQGKTIVGPAITLRYISERNTTTSLFIEKAKAKLGDKDLYAISEPGDVAVFDVGGRIISTLGGLSTLLAKRENLAGNIVDGGVRDIEDIRKLNYPVWARWVTPITGKYRLEAIEINGPIMCYDVQIFPGDLVIADDTGLVFIPLDKSEEVLAKAKTAIERENKVIEAFNKGAKISELTEILPVDKW